MHQERETWWWSNVIQDVIKKKLNAYKEWQHDQGNTELQRKYKEHKRKAKKEVAKAKKEATKDWYDNLGTKEGE